MKNLSNSPTCPNPSRSSIPRWVLFLCLATVLFGVIGREPWTPDEPREAAIAAAMARGEGIFIPRLAGQPFVEKPPLYYWLSALSMRVAAPVFDEADAARAFSALCAGLTLLLVWSTVRQIRGREFAAAATAILATAYGFFRAGHWIIIDPLLMLLVTASVLGLFLGLSQERDLPFLGGCLAGGLAFLTKGFVAWGLLFFPGILLGIFYFRQLFQRPGRLALGGLLLLSPPAIWMLLFRLGAGPELWREWFLVNQIGRFSGASGHLDNIRGPFYYLWLAPLLLLPWTPALLGRIFTHRRNSPSRPPEKSSRLTALAIVWGLGGLLILSLAGTKREVYLYPLLPAYALLTATALKRLPRWSEAVLGGIAALFSLVILFFAFALPTWAGEEFTLQLGLEPTTALLGIAAAVAFFYLRKQPAARIAAVAALFYIAAGRAAPPILNQVWSYRPMTETLTAAIPPAAHGRVAIWGYDETTQGVFFLYSGLKLPMLKNRDRARRALRGKDEEFDLLIVPRPQEFRRDLSPLPPLRVLASAPKGPRRIFYLIGPPRKLAK